MAIVSGEFDVKLTPQKPDNPEAESAGVARISLDKRFHGALEATSTGEMLSMMTEVKGSGVYVAVERVTGALNGLRGSFALHHRGTMTRVECPNSVSSSCRIRVPANLSVLPAICKSKSPRASISRNSVLRFPKVADCGVSQHACGPDPGMAGDPFHNRLASDRPG